jgi:membrane-anchored mycosin MYCP
MAEAEGADPTNQEVHPPMLYDQLYVDMRDAQVLRELMTRKLPELHIQPIDESPELGLARWAVPGAAEAAVTVRNEAGDVGHMPDLDVVLWWIREKMRQEHAGWVPTVDWNQDHGDIETSPHVKIAIDDPAPVDLTPAQFTAQFTAGGAGVLDAAGTDGAGAPVAALQPGLLHWGQPAGPRVGIADARVFAHELLAGRFIGEPEAGPGPFPTAGPGHATFVAGTVLRRAPSAVLVCRPVLVHGARNTSWDVARRLVAFIDDDLAVLNMSFGGWTDGSPPLPLRRALDRLGGRTVLVAAAGNHGRETPRPIYPAAFGDVVAVGAIEADGSPAPFVPKAPWVDLLAPGVDVIGPFLRGEVNLDQGGPTQFPSGYAKWRGSSFAAAAVSGEIARRIHERGLTPFAARDELLAEVSGDGNRAPDISPFEFTLASSPTG